MIRLLVYKTPKTKSKVKKLKANDKYTTKYYHECINKPLCCSPIKLEHNLEGLRIWICNKISKDKIYQYKAINFSVFTEKVDLQQKKEREKCSRGTTWHDQIGRPSTEKYLILFITNQSFFVHVDNQVKFFIANIITKYQY